MKFLLVLFVAVTILATGEALKCYVCTSLLSGCDNPFDKSTDAVREVTCPGQYHACSKFAATAGGYDMVARGCALNSATCTEATHDGRACYSCDTDLCNGVSATGAALSMLMVVAVPLVFRNFY